MNVLVGGEGGECQCRLSEGGGRVLVGSFSVGVFHHILKQTNTHFSVTFY